MADLAIKLLWLSVALDAVGTFLLWQQIQSDPSHSILGPVVGLVLTFWVVSRIAAGRMWARIVFLLLMIAQIAAIFAVPGLADLMFAQSNIQGLLNVATTVLYVVAIVLLFLPAFPSAARPERVSLQLPMVDLTGLISKVYLPASSTLMDLEFCS
jgi:hypothetical protein